MSDDLEVKRAANRAAFPGVAAIVDEFRAVFGEGVKVLAGEDYTTGKSFGVMPDRSACISCAGAQCALADAGVFCGYRLVLQRDLYPMEVYRKHGMGMGRHR